MSKSLEKKLIDVCVFLHTELSSMQNDLDDSIMELSQVLRLDPHRALEQITENIKDLLKIKRNFSRMDEYKGYKAHEQYQKALQKLEGEVRHHIKIEQQMKLHIDSTQAKIEDLEKNQDSGLAESLKRENMKLLEKIKCMEKQMENSEEKIRYVKELNMLKGLAQQDSMRYGELEKTNRKLEMEVNYLQRKVEVLNRELNCERHALKENRPESVLKKRNNEEEDIRVVSSQLTDRCRNGSKQDLKKGMSKSPISSRVELKRTESQFMSSTRLAKKKNETTEKTRKHTQLTGTTHFSIR